MLTFKDIVRYDRMGLYKDYARWVKQAEEALATPFEAPEPIHTQFDSNPGRGSLPTG